MCWCCHQCSGPLPILGWPLHAQLATWGHQGYLPTTTTSVYAIFPFFASILESFLTIAFLKVILLHYCCSVVARVLLFGEVMQVFYDWNLGSINCAS